jgi:hypothetical protein
MSQPSRWTTADISRFYDDERIALARRRGVVFTAFAFLILTLIVPSLYFLWLVVTLAVEGLVDSSARSPLRHRKQYEHLRAYWVKLLEDSAPNAVMTPRAPLQDGESVIYADLSSRYLERHLGTRSTPVSRANTTSAKGLPASQASTTEEIYGEVSVDEGQLIITDRRVLFLGKRDTLEIPSTTIFRYSFLQSPDRLVFEYAGRPSGESFTIKKLFFQLCMYRRSKVPAGSVPMPPAPLPENTCMETVTRSDTAIPEAST